MENFEIEQLRRLYACYSPLTTNKKLLDCYLKITNDPRQSLSSIRKAYNKNILNGFWNEAVIKSAFVKKFCFKRSPSATVTIFELNVKSSRADLCIINGSSMVFEIKTEYDTFARLEKQLNDYISTFDYINMIVPESSIQQTVEGVGDLIGIISYKKNSSGGIAFEIVREPQINNKIDSETQLSQLSISELRNTQNLKGSTSFNRSELIKNILNDFCKDEINEIYRNYIKNKYREKWCFLRDNRNQIYDIDFQWFFKNNIPVSIVYK